MKPLAALANSLWIASGLRSSRRFTRALHAPAAAQARWLTARIARDAGTEFGRQHDFATLSTPADFAQRVPLSDAGDVARWIPRIQRGEQDLLTADRVTHLAPTSGSTGARKLVPFTASLRASFAAAVSPWMVDLARARPPLLGGPAYWSVSPLTETDHDADATHAVPTGFADDADYLGGWAAALVRQALAVPAAVRHVRDEQAFFALTLLALLRQRELRLVSVWHPSFLQLLVEAAAPHWDALLEAIAVGTAPWLDAIPPAHRDAWRATPDRTRASELRRIGAHDWPRWWPALQVVSCWGDQAAAPGCAALAAALPQVLVQSKGLLATEAVVTVPAHGAYPLAVTSHFFEFLDARGDIRLAHELERGAAYEVIVTNGGGLWRYRLGDLVACTGHLGATPSLRFLGRTGNTSDLRGEKLSEPFVAECLRALWQDGGAPALAELHAVAGDVTARYELHVPHAVHAGAARRLDALLRANPHYDLARRLGQLAPVQVLVTPSIGAAASGVRLGDRKPRTLVPQARDSRHTLEVAHG